jgi:Probable zinc-ribbon domain
MSGNKSNKQRAAELKARRAKRTLAGAKKRQAQQRVYAVDVGGTPVNPALLALDNSYGVPDFVKRGTYLDQSFDCCDCSKREVWSATRQKWWYEVAKGGVWTRPLRCQPCRRKERERIAEQRRVSEVGREKKAKLKVAGKWRTGL